MNFRFDILYEYRWMFLTGALMTLGLTFVATLGGTLLGLLGALARIIRFEKGSAPLRAAAWVVRNLSLLYVTVFRGTPLFVQIFIWYFVWLPALIHPADGWLVSGTAAVELRRNYGALIAGVLALTANSGAYITEIFRAGIQSIDKGQMEAARSLGMTYTQAMRFVILPQAVRRICRPWPTNSSRCSKTARCSRPSPWPSWPMCSAPFRDATPCMKSRSMPSR